jgi:HEAT repeat protein
MLCGDARTHQQTMSETTTSAAQQMALRFARLVARMQAEPGALNEHRQDVRTFTKSLKKTSLTLRCVPAITADAAPTLEVGESRVEASEEEDRAAVDALALRFSAYALEQLTLAGSATDADLFDLVKLLATPADQADAPAFFAARAAAVDSKAIPRVLRKKELPPEPVPEVVVPAAELAPIVEASSISEHASAGSVDIRSERLTEALAVPAGSDAELVELFAKLPTIEDSAELRAPLERMVFLADIAFRTGKFDRMLEVMTALVAIEFLHLERDSSDERRREFAQALRRLASPVILRQLAVMRHRRADDALATRQLQALLYRFGSDGAEALIDEWAVAATAEARALCLEALRGLRRAHDALFEAVRHTDPTRVRQAAELLAALGDVRAEQLLLEQIRHPDAKTRRAVVAGLEVFASPSAFDAIGVAAIDEDAIVRLRAVAALAKRGAAAVKLIAPMLDTEPELEVLYAAIAALGTIGTADAVQVLIRAANGESDHPRKRSASYRLQACAALAVIRTPQAMAAVQLLRDDRDREVREGSMRLVAQAARRSTTTQRAVPST